MKPVPFYLRPWGKIRTTVITLTTFIFVLLFFHLKIFSMSLSNGTVYSWNEADVKSPSLEEVKSSSKVKLACWVMTKRGNEAKADAVQATWGKRCDSLVFITCARLDSNVKTHILDCPETRDFLWMKTIAGFKYIYEKHFHDSNWFVRVDDDGYIIVENLRHFLSDKDPEDPVFFGSAYKAVVETGYAAGGPGIVLSREALRRMIEEGFSRDWICPTQNLLPTHVVDDVELGDCLGKLGVKLGDDRDSEGRKRFYPLTLNFHLRPEPKKDFWYWNYIKYPESQGPNCCSTTPIGFHYVTPNLMRLLDYFIYRVKLL